MSDAPLLRAAAPVETCGWPKSLVDNPRIGAWLSFAEPGIATIFTGKVELGQGIAETIAGAAAAVLDLDRAAIRVVSGDTMATPDEWYTAGSQSVEVSLAAILAACGEARRVRDGDGTAVPAADRSYWDLVDTLAAVPVTSAAIDWAAIDALSAGNSRTDIAARINSGVFIHDKMLPGMLHARMVRGPVAGVRALAVPADAVTEPGARLIRDGDFLAVLAEDEWVAVKVARRLHNRIPWSQPQTATIPADPTTWLAGVPALDRLLAPRRGDPAIDGPRFYASFTRQALLHASIGPSCALAQETDGLLVVWTHSQGVFPLRNALARALGRPAESIRVLHAPGAGCYGHNGADDVAFDAAWLASRHATGRPVRVIWSREEEFGQAPMGPPMLTEIEAGLGPDGRIADWAVTVTSAPHGRRPSFNGDINLLGATEVAGGAPMPPPQPVPAAMGGGAERNAIALYDLPGQALTHRFVQGFPLRTSSMRALGAHLNIVAIEGAMDALAALAGQDPLAFRLAHLSDPRAMAVVKEAARLGWGDEVARKAEIGSGRARGFGFARYKNKAAYMAIVTEVEIDEAVRLIKATAVVDCGSVASRDGVLNQVEGGIVQAASFTLFEAARIEDGRNVTATWEDYSILGFRDVPALAVTIVPRAGDPPLGVGEVATGPASAAIVNAVSRALGARLTALPITRERIIEALQAV